jgi:predicted nucleic acid-binding protein
MAAISAAAIVAGKNFPGILKIGLYIGSRIWIMNLVENKEPKRRNEMEKVIKAYKHGIISREEAVEALQRKHGLTKDEAEKAIPVG